ncbi:hypothetical protein D5086_020430 [Populus alba]|uniref:Uncharacterized protein n=1 Tax=Populus alba TaxID=43335 RepID=A0ACC4BKQ0_POPAL
MQEEEEHSFLNARSDEDKAFLLALYRAADITASATKFCPFLASLQLQNLHMYLRTFAPKAVPRKVAKAIPKMPARMPGTTNELPPLFPTFTFLYWNIRCHFLSSEPSISILASRFLTFRNSEPFINGRKDRDEDLLLFKELHRREKDRLAGLLQPVSDEFEPNIAGKFDCA